MSEAGGGAVDPQGADARDAGEEKDFETALRELETIVARLDADDVDLDEAMALFERGIARLRRANRLLDEAKGRVEELITESSGALRAAELDGPGPDAGEEAS